jgi:hypothetical protein
MKMEPVGFEFATGEQAREGLLYPPEAGFIRRPAYGG